jgi:hypothetical protein
VLNYLRADGGDVRDFLPTSRQALWALVSEAKFYGLARLQVCYSTLIKGATEAKDKRGNYCSGLRASHYSMGYQIYRYYEKHQ